MAMGPSSPASTASSRRLTVKFPKDPLPDFLVYPPEYRVGDVENFAMSHHITWLSDEETRSVMSLSSDITSFKPSEKPAARQSIIGGSAFSGAVPLSAGGLQQPRTSVFTESLENLRDLDDKEEGQENDTPVYPEGMKFTLIIVALCFAVFVMALDNSIIATAIPKITDEFHSLNDVGWYGSAYMLTSSALQLLFGKFYTFWSLKWIFLACVVIFEAGSLICGIAPNSITLIIGRAVAGIGSAGIFAGALTILAFSCPLEKRPLYTGVVSGMWGISSVAGPVLGGIFTDQVSWRWCFYINLPVGAVTLVVIFFCFDEPQRKITPATWRQRFWQMDPLGTVVFMPAVICMLLALHWGGSEYPWDSGRIVALIMLSVFLLIVFLQIQHRMQDDATVPPRIFRKRSVWSSALFEFFVGACFLEAVYFLPMWFQAVKGASAIMSGVMNLPMLLVVVVCSVVSGALVTRWGYYTPFIYACAVLMPIGYGLLSTLAPRSPAVAWIGFQVIAGMGVGLGMQQPLIAVQAVLDLADVPTGTAMIIFFQALGGALFVSAGQTVFTNKLAEGVRRYAPDLDAAFVEATGATNLRHVFSGPQLSNVIRAFNFALSNCFYVAAAAAAASAVGAAVVEWKSVKGKNIEAAMA
ncbi:putative HC-toxin efflux carrier [Escovopsis weberi]|uniref:Putative HC-toxin efflux carrier n=1 Tax=Escovopsis weberi TaxID=150374 RepID=A0A0M8MY52_ESCWE|nr:putative HC-toxin efflux carrier [Escovopsis weberi]